MSKIKYSLEQFKMLGHLSRWFAMVLPVAVSIGLIVAFFLWLLDLATQTRWQNLWLIFLLPLAGIFIFWLYHKFGKNAESGNNLIIDEIHSPTEGVPVRMAPLILFTTVITHLFGGSAGREGTAVQIGGSIAALFSKWFKVNQEEKRILLMCGIAAGFGAVFGTPVAGAVFALEVITIGRIKYDALFPCLAASIIAHFTCISCNIHHTQYNIIFINDAKGFFSFLSFDVLLLMKVIIAGMLFGFIGYLFAQLTIFIKNKCHQFITIKWFIPVFGAALIIGISYTIGTFDYLGLGVKNPNENGISIVSAFHLNGANYFSWFWKLLLTAITLGTGFKGGEVTPLFFIGATLGNVLAVISGAPIDLFAGLGFIAVFAGATNTPLACTIMGVELFGGENVIYYAVACFIAYYFSGHTGIYHAQRKESNKF